MYFYSSVSKFVFALFVGAISIFLFNSGVGFAQSAGNAPVMKISTGIGSVWADKKGMTLYTFKKDVTGKSNCNAKCATAWPPLMAAKNAKAAGDFSIVTRKDGSMQWALKGMPLYLWSKDKKKGDTTGHNLGGVWDAAQP